MPKEIYEVIAQGARYWFLFLMLLIVWRSYRWYRRDKKQAKKRLKLLPDAGYVGELVVLQGGEGLQVGDELPVPCEGTLGSLRTNDLCVPAAGVAKRHLWFRFDDGRGLMVEPLGQNAVTVDGEEFQSRREPLYMAHGSRLYVGEAVLRLRLFAGFEGAARAARPVENAESVSEVQQAPLPPEYAAQMQQWLRQQQWLMQQMAQHQAYQQWLAQQQGQPTDAQETAFADEYMDEYADEEHNANETEPDGMHAYDERIFMRPEGEARPEVPAYAPVTDAAENAPQPDADDPPCMQDLPAAEDYAYAPEDWDEDMTDAALPPKSAYVGHDEAERMKRKLWDKYLGGGHDA